ncbi:MAG: hypothetical protein LC802_24150 [Acidobacteria bacterium]|nr:hypothetical protein [Acidobacteriota bacterium]
MPEAISSWNKQKIGRELKRCHSSFKSRLRNNRRKGILMTVGNAQSPFLNLSSFEIGEAEAQAVEVRATAPVSSPFVSVYESIEGEGDYDDPAHEAFSTVVNDLYDEEFDEALFELMTDVRNLHQDHLTSGHTQAEADKLVTQHVSQLTRECEAMVDAMSREFGNRDESTIVEREVESFVGAYAPV